MTPGSKVQCSASVSGSSTRSLMPSACGGAGSGSGGAAGLLRDLFAPGDLIERLTVVGGEEAHEGAPHADRQDQPDHEEGGEEAAVLLEVHVEGGDHEELGRGEDEQRDECGAGQG